MSATSLYIKTARFVLGSNTNDTDTWTELCQYLPSLRQALSCCVCQQILHTPMGPTESACEHHVCKECIGGVMRLKPQCSWCKDFNAFVENPQLHIIVQCFRKLCEYLASSVVPNQLNLMTNNGGTQSNALMAIIQEAIVVRDDIAGSSDRTVHDAVPPKLQKENSTIPSPPLHPTSQPNPLANKTETTEDIEKNNGSANLDIDEKHLDALSPSPPALEGIESEHEEEVQPHPVLSSESSVPRVRVRRRRDRSGRRRRRRQNRPRESLIKTETKPIDLNENAQDSDKSKHILNNSSPKINEDHHDGNSVPELGEESHENSSDIPILKISETVAIEHDYNKGSLSDEESNKLSLAPKLIPAVPVDNEVTLKRAKLERPPIHDRTMVPKKAKKTAKSKVKSGCRCGLATAKPGNLTCCGQRCPCYSSFKGCTDCRCRGCRNPRGDPAKNPLALQLQQIQHQQLQFPQLRSPLRSSEESDVEIDV